MAAAANNQGFFEVIQYLHLPESLRANPVEPSVVRARFGSVFGVSPIGGNDSSLPHSGGARHSSGRLLSFQAERVCDAADLAAAADQQHVEADGFMRPMRVRGQRGIRRGEQPCALPDAKRDGGADQGAA